MTGNFLLFDTTCPACTNVARRLRELDVHDLSVRSLHDPEIVEVFQSTGTPVPNKPALVHIGGPETLTVYTGLAMRMRLARMLGARRAAEIVGLAAAEVQAHVARRTEDKRWSRRRLLGGAAGATGALVFGAALPSAAASGAPRRGTPLTAAAKQRLLASPRLQKAARIWGAVDDGAIETVIGDGERLVAVPHRGGTRAVTLLRLDDDDALGVTITPNPDETGIRYHLAESGLPIAELSVHNGQVATRALDYSAAPPGADPEPLGVREFTTCFVVCIGATVPPECIAQCIACVTGGLLVKAVACPYCLGCARLGVRCANECKDLL